MLQRDGCFPHRTEDYIVLKRLAEEYHLAMAYYYLGCLLYDRRVYDESIEDYEESILRSPDFPTVQESGTGILQCEKSCRRERTRKWRKAFALDETGCQSVSGTGSAERNV